MASSTSRPQTHPSTSSSSASSSASPSHNRFPERVPLFDHFSNFSGLSRPQTGPGPESAWPAADASLFAPHSLRHQQPLARPAPSPDRRPSLPLQSSFGYLFPSDDYQQSAATTNTHRLEPPSLIRDWDSLQHIPSSSFFSEFPTNDWRSRLRHSREEAHMPTASTSDARKRRHQDASDNGGVEPKRQRHAESSSQAIDLDEVDLAGDDDTAQSILQIEREELIKSQRDADDGPLKFSEMNCIICMDNYTDLTATPCGHIFCHECLHQALMAGERGERGAGSCPVCRKPLKRNTKSHVIPLSLMTKSKFRQGVSHRAGL